MLRYFGPDAAEEDYGEASHEAEREVRNPEDEARNQDGGGDSDVGQRPSAPAKTGATNAGDTATKSFIPKRGAFPSSVAFGSQVQSSMLPGHNVHRGQAGLLPPGGGANLKQQGQAASVSAAAAAKQYHPFQTQRLPTHPQPAQDPLQVTGVSVSSEPNKLNGQMVAVVTVHWTPATDPAYGGVDIWATNYHGSSVPILVASILSLTATSQTFSMDATGELVTLTVQSIAPSGDRAVLSGAPTVTVTLSATGGEPPAPTISQTLLAVPNFGYQFAFDYVGALLTNIIQTYNIYRNTTNAFSGSTLVRSVPHPQTSSGSYTFQDSLGSNNTTVYYYFVTTVDINGNESGASSAQTGAITPSSSLDNVPDSATRVALAASHSASNVSYNYQGVWSSATAYVKGDEVVYATSYWLALLGSTNSAPATGNANWQVVGTYSGFLGAWSSTPTYAPGAEVTYNNNFWVCVTSNTNSAPTTSNSNWQIAGPVNLDAVDNGVVYARHHITELPNGYYDPSAASNANAQTQYTSAVTGAQDNLIPDSDLKFGTAYWNLAAQGGGQWIISKAGDNTHNCLEVIGNGAALTTYVKSAVFSIEPGTYTLSLVSYFADNIISGELKIGIYDPGVTTVYGAVYVPSNTAQGARVSGSVTIPSGVTQAIALAYGNGAVLPSGYGTCIQQMQLEAGSSMTAYRPNALDRATGGLASGISVQEPGGSLSSMLLGDGHERVRTTIGGYGNTGLDNVLDGVNTLRSPTGIGAEGLSENGSFQNGLTGWKTASCTAQVNGPADFAGLTNAFDVQVNYTSAGGGIIMLRRLTVVAGETYKVAGWVYSNASTDQSQILLACNDGSGNYLGGVAANDTGYGVWHYITASGTVPAGAVQAQLIFKAGNATASGAIYATALNAWRVRSLDDEVSDGPTLYNRVANVNADHTFHSSTSFNNQGSLVPLVGTPNALIEYDTATSVLAEVVAGTLYLPNGTTISVPAFNQTYSTWAGQAVAYPPVNSNYTVYNCYYGSIVWDVVSQAVVVIQQGALMDGPNNNSATLTPAQTATLIGDNYITLLKCQCAVYQTNPDGTHATSNPNGASGGSSTQVCPCASQKVETLQGEMAAGSIKAGYAVRGEQGEWVVVSSSTKSRAQCVSVTLRLPDASKETLKVTEKHQFRMADGSWRAAQDLVASDVLDGGSRVLFTSPLGERDIQSLEVAGHIYRLGSTFSHNVCYY